jgi:hypothetical protein
LLHIATARRYFLKNNTRPHEKLHENRLLKKKRSASVSVSVNKEGEWGSIKEEGKEIQAYKVTEQNKYQNLIGIFAGLWTEEIHDSIWVVELSCK